MSEQTGSTTTTEETNSGADFEPITSQEALDKIIQSRIARERSKFADYDDVKARAAKLDEIEEANKSEVVRAQEAAQAAANELATVRLEAARFKIAAKHGIGEEHFDFLTGADEAEIEAKAEKLSSLVKTAEPERKGAWGPFDKDEGRSPSSAGGSTADKFAEFVGQRL